MARPDPRGRRDGRRISQSATARWDSYFPGDQLGGMWKKMPEVMLAKCAEAAAFRKLFPTRFAGLYVNEEMAQADAPAEPMRPAPTAQQRIAERRARLTALPAAVGEEASGATPAPAPEGPGEPPVATAPAEGPSQCEDVSRISGERCRRETGHRGLHLAPPRESWE